MKLLLTYIKTLLTNWNYKTEETIMCAKGNQVAYRLATNQTKIEGSNTTTLNQHKN